MKRTQWQERARAAGLTQRTLAALLGHTEVTISRQLTGQWESGTPVHVVSAIIAWELMSNEQRKAWIGAVANQAG